MTINLTKLYLIDKRNLVRLLYYFGIMIAFFASVNVSYTWPIQNTYTLIASVFIGAAMLMSNSLEDSVFSRRDFLWPTLSCLLLLFYQLVTSDLPLISYLIRPFSLFIFFSLFRLKLDELQALCDTICKTLAVFLCFSIFAFFLFLMGFHLPSRNAQWGDIYFYTDYIFFLHSDRSMLNIIPRFHSVFLEPGHLGTVCVLLLAAQYGRWKKWYNIILIFTLFITFSLAGYVLFVIVYFIQLWLLHRHVLKKALVFILIVGAVVGGSFFYRDGENMLNQLIVMRLEVNEEGDDIEGNNRVTSDFESEFDSFIMSSDALFGREMPKGVFGNAGYRVYIYEYGIIGLVLVYLFYFIAMRTAISKRALLAMFILSTANFWIRAYPLWFGFFIPYYILAMRLPPTTLVETADCLVKSK